MYKLKINNNFYKFSKKYTIIQACYLVGIEIPRFCYHDKLSIAGNCRMCLVEVSKSPKPVASCALSIMDGMEIYTQTSLVKKAREGVLEFLLSNHPLDCPICDQGGECDLQDQSLIFGSDRGRFFEYKRAVEDKDCGPFIKTLMTRCIHCTRCVRFATEIAGISSFGVTGRGSKMEIGTYIDKVLISELSGNIIDLCPVGALTSKPFAYSVRSWELSNEQSIDFSDALNSNIRIEYINEEIKRVLPMPNENVNEEWISDNARFNYDGLKYQRLLYPLIKHNGQFLTVNWHFVLNKLRYMFLRFGLFDNTTNSSFSTFLGNYIDLKSSFILKEFLSVFNNEDSVQPLLTNNYNYLLDQYSNYITPLSMFDLNTIDLVLLVNSNPRLEMPLFNHKLRKLYLKNKIRFFSCGNTQSFNFKTYQLGINNNILSRILIGRHWVCNFILKSNNPIFLFGLNYIRNRNSSELFYFLNMLKNKFLSSLKYSVISSISSIPNINFIGFQNKYSYNYNNNSMFYFLYNFELLKTQNYIYKIYLGFIGDKGALNADIILPSTSYVEHNGLSMNVNGCVQKYKKVFYSTGEAFNDWQILTLLLRRSLCFFDFSPQNYELLLSSLDYFIQYSYFLNKNLNYFNMFFMNQKCLKNNYHFDNNIFNSLINTNFLNKYNTVDKYSININKGFKNFKYKYKYNF